jgi:hypothetical protein
LRYTPLTELQSETIGFTPLYEDVLFNTLIEGYTVFKVTQAVRKVVKEEALEREFGVRLLKLEDQSIPVDMEQLLSEVDADLRRMSEITLASYLVVFDHYNKRFLIDGQRAKAELALQLVKQIIREDSEGDTPSFEVLMPEHFLMQKILTDYVLNPNSVPEPLVVDEMVKIGSKTIAGAKPKSANITVKAEDITSDEFTKHLTDRRAVHSLALDWDGCIYANVDHTLMISGIKFEGDLKYKEDLTLDAADDFTAEYTLILPEVSKFVNLLESELVK